VTDESTHAESKDPSVASAMREYFDLLDRGISVDRENFIGQNPKIAHRLRSAIDHEDARRLGAAEPSPGQLTGGSTGAFTRHGDTLPPSARSHSAAACNFPPGTQLGRYRIVRVLGRGAMGTVYLAIDTQLDRQVALKTPQFDQDSDLLQRFHREARAAAALRHPNICPIYDFGQIDGTQFLSMAYIEGQTLAALMESEPLQPVKRVAGIARKIALALQEAHDHGIVHRDLKPSNVMLDKHSEPIVMDFGLARQTTGQDNVRLTQSGILVGTPAFMSPEQIEGDVEKIGPATDQYSLGVLLYELFTQQLPFRGSSMAIIAQALVKEPPPPIQFRTDLDPRINAVCLKMMAKAPEDRFASLSEVADVLEAILENRDPKPTLISATAKADPSLSPERAAAKQRRRSLAAQFLSKRSLSEDELVEVEKAARRHFDLGQYEKVVEAIGQVPDEQRPARLQGLLADARTKTTEVAALVTAIDEAERRGDKAAALEKSSVLLKLQPGNPRACEVRNQADGPSFLAKIQNASPRTLWAVVLVGLALLAALVVALLAR
jgi:serine/threonine protein kinase